MSEPESGLNPIAVSHDNRLGVSRDVHRNVVADAVVAVVPEPDRSTAACHAAAVFNRHDDSPDARPSLGALDDVHTDAVERRQTATNYLYGKD